MALSGYGWIGKIHFIAVYRGRICYYSKTAILSINTAFEIVKAMSNNTDILSSVLGWSA